MEIDFFLEREIKEYCEINEIEFAEYVNKLLKRAFMIDKYGDRPAILDIGSNKSSEYEPINEPIKGNDAIKKEIIPQEEPISQEKKKRGRPKKETVITIKTFKPEKEIKLEKQEEEIIIKPKKRKLT